MLTAYLLGAEVIYCWCWQSSSCMTSMPTYAGDGAAESCWWRRCRGDLVTARCRCWVMLATVLPSHGGDGAIGAIWSWRDVHAESCWWRRCRVMLATALLGWFCHGVMYMSSHAGDGIVGVTWPRCDVDAESCWRWRCWRDLAATLCTCRVMLATVLPGQLGRGLM
jgi:hypothetical protein